MAKNNLDFKIQREKNSPETSGPLPDNIWSEKMSTGIIDSGEICN